MRSGAIWKIWKDLGMPYVRVGMPVEANLTVYAGAWHYMYHLLAFMAAGRHQAIWYALGNLVPLGQSVAIWVGLLPSVAMWGDMDRTGGASVGGCLEMRV